ncbi:MAG TPA: hypothetical protein VMH28_22675 [Candidatus Acidoferrales bacterium]|nr:hypothetical protein [Candidatus Acidoferrales bacterium]
MSAHLASGCPGCSGLADFTGKLARTCIGLSQAAMPESAMRMARAIFPVAPKNRPKGGTRLPVELIFDSFLVPAPAGMRATWQLGWQGLYRAGDCSVDLRIEPELKSPRASVIGQITNHVAPEDLMSNLPVSLRSGRQVVAETVSNAFGEFQLEYEEQPQLKLYIGLAGSETIQLPLKTSAADGRATLTRKRSGNAPGRRDRRGGNRPK